MKLNIQPSVIFRTPKFSYQSELSDCWEELKAAISISSATFYETIKEVSAVELKDLPPKVYFTIWKYFNRAKFRSTPYGTFAGFSLLNEGVKPSESKIVITEEQKIRELVDWPYKNNIRFPLSDLLQKNCMLFSNSSYYFTPNSIRYIACADGIFELAELDENDLVKQILNACLKPIAIHNLIAALNLKDTEVDNLFELLQDMHDLQLIFTDYDPNIIGKDYFERIGLMGTKDLPKYLIAQRTVQSGHLNEQVLQSIPNMVKMLHTILPVNNREALSRFITGFKKKFEEQEIPLLLALDPEMGIGYDELEQAGHNDDFISKLKSRPARSENAKGNIKPVFKDILSPQSFEKGKPILLNKLTVKPTEDIKPLPNSFSMIMSVSDGLVFAEQIGGVTSNALTGRFTMADEAVEHYAKSIAEAEQTANPDVLFFDVAYMVETNVDNVNRRKLIYGRQLSILNFDTSEDPLTLNDIQLSVKGNEVVLRSKRLNKRLVPRLASAYNYSRSDLSVFRLLCDLQHQGLQNSLSLTLDTLFPDLDYYPRLQYQNIVLSNCKWKIKKDDLLDKDKKILSAGLCRAHLVEIGVGNYFKAGLSDQTLCFALHSDDDLNAFLQYMQKQSSLYIEEVKIPTDSLVIDEEGKPYFAQFILSINHQQKIYEVLLPDEAQVQVTRHFPPGSEWLYFEIYCHQQRSDQILAEVIAPFLENYQTDIISWFFIRYNENGNHIRLRLQLNNKSRTQALTSGLMDELALFLNSGLVSDIQIKTYKRELERYGHDMIENVEQHFSVDSGYVLSLFETQPDHFEKYQLCGTLVSKIIKAGVFGQQAMVKIIRSISDSFNQEHQLDAADFKQLNNQYQQFRNAEFNVLNITQEQQSEAFASSLISILQQEKPENRVKLFSNLMHMHINRLFNRDQRTHEMVMYYFLLKDMQRQNAMQA
ncbi:lantibiotic dehydratase [Pedobacter sp. UBA5917]|jgi:thiopeptide-type bacteriocin biosynthesis protein|uniref:lantibiotic dehydratase n=1 Tax=Pedobacter sp. UBA5917 TaxID=1947061 RepID=UPI0025E4A5E5|nr:lantibiotic dehydratase [Pedobacter sp. UBA5917]